MVKNKYIKDDLHRLLEEKVDAQTYYEETVQGVRFYDGNLQSDVMTCHAVSHSRGGKNTPSLSINLNAGARCFGCGLKASDVIWFHAQYFRIDIEEAKKYLYKKYVGNLMDELEILRYRRSLRKNIKEARNLERRGVTRDQQKEFKIGWDNDEDRFIFPKRGPHVGYLGISRITIKPDEFFKERGIKKIKKLSVKGSIETLYPFWVKRIDSEGKYKEGTVFDDIEIVCVEGEIDALTCRAQGFNAITMGGAGHWHGKYFKENYIEYFRGKRVVIFLDNDPTGRDTAEKLYDLLRDVAAKVVIIFAPRGNDASAYFMEEEGSPEELRSLIDNAFGDVDVIYEIRNKIEKTDIIEVDRLSAVTEPQNYGHRVGVSGIVVAETEEPYSLPKLVSVTCERDVGNVCKACPNFARGGETKFEYNDFQTEILDFVDAAKTFSRTHFKEATGIPKLCNSFNVDWLETRRGQWVMLAPPLGTDVNQAREGEIQAFNIGKRIIPNKYCKYYGYVYRRDKSKSIYVITDWEPLSTDYESFKVPNKSKVKNLKRKFGPKKITAKNIIRKLKRTANLIARNYTKIYHRPELHIAEMLRMHSALEFNFDNQLKNAYIETLIIGDTKVGKSAVIKGMQKLYNAGVFVDGSSVSKAGLVGGMTNNPQMFRAGSLVQAHATAFCIDESKDFIPTLETMKVVREGIYTYIKVIGSRQGKCQVRLCCLANDPKGLLSHRQFGCTSLIDLIPDPADISRFTYFLVLRQGDIPSINKRNPEPIDTDIEQKDFQNILMSCWSRKPENIHITDEAVDECYALAEEMSQAYSSSMHIVQETTQWHKLAQVATAIAGQQFNIDEDGKLIVEAAHVEAAKWWFDTLYSLPGCAYDAYSLNEKRFSSLKSKKELFKQVFKKELDHCGNLEHCITTLLDGNLLTYDDISDAFEHCIEPFQARGIAKTFKVQRAFKKTQKGFKYTEAFYRYLNELKRKYL